MEDKPIMTKYQIIVDRNKCIAAGGCVAVASLTFKIDEDNKVGIIDQDGNSDQEKLLAAQSCPVGAIKVINSENGEILWPKN